MSDLKQQLDAARATVALLEQRVRSAPCREVGHRWKSTGGANAGCHDDCCCSVPVHDCEVCGASDYGENDEAKQVIEECKLEGNAP